MRTPANIYVRIAIALGSYVGYVIVFLLAYHLAGPVVTVLSGISLVIIGWVLGINGSLFFGLINIPLNVFLLTLVRDRADADNLISILLGNFAFMLVGVGAGWVRQLLERINRQAEELRDERKVLREEIEKRTQAEERLSYEALHDPLTSLPNRRLFMDRLNHAVEWNKRYPTYVFSVVYLDFDRFKVINDSLGHNIGDQLLMALARRLKASVREMDTVARMGGDEFAIMLETVQDYAKVLQVVQRIQANLLPPFEIQQHSIVMTASIGVVLNIVNYDRLDNILRDADIAMYHAKTNGKNQYKVFDFAMRQAAEELLELESDLRTAIQEGQFCLHYQPIISLKTKQLTGFEALIRWNHPTKGLLYPADFIQVAEDSGLIVPIGQWVLFEACRQMKQWQTHFHVDPPLTISVNLSNRQFAEPVLIQQVTDILEEADLPPEQLMLELTEMTLIEDVQTAIDKIRELRALGIKVGIDDFGTGYSSLGYLRYLPVNSLKIDRSFVNTLESTQNSTAIIHAIIAMANSLGMNVIAEGIETSEQAEDLEKLECDYGQGYLFNKPLDDQAAQNLIKDSIPKGAKRKTGD